MINVFFINFALFDRYPEYKGGAFAKTALHPDIPSMLLDDVLDYGQTQSDGSTFAALRKLRETVKDMRQILRCNAAAGVAAIKIKS